MKIDDKMRRECYFKEIQEGEIFKYFIRDVTNGPFYGMKTENIYENNKVIVNAVDLDTGELFYIEANEIIIVVTAKLIVE